MREEATHTERKERIANSPKQSEKGGGGKREKRVHSPFYSLMHAHYSAHFPLRFSSFPLPVLLNRRKGKGKMKREGG